MLPVLLSGLVADIASAAPILLVDPFSGKLVGAQDVVVEGKDYDVTFVFNTCDALFAACAGPNEGDPAYDPAADRAPFPGPSGGGDVAAAALRDQVFIDGAAPGAAKFDSHPSLTNCPPGKSASDCYVHSPTFWAPKNSGPPSSARSLPTASQKPTTPFSPNIAAKTIRCSTPSGTPLPDRPSCSWIP